MRINDVNTPSKTSQTKKKKGVGTTSGTGEFSAIFETQSTDNEPVQEAHNIVNIQSVLSIDSIGILSNASNEDYIKQENVSWGKDILKQLEGIKYQILNGKVSYSSLLSLKERLNNIPINPADQKLQQIVQDIEIRAAVELEKLKRLTESTNIFINQEEV